MKRALALATISLCLATLASDAAAVIGAPVSNAAFTGTARSTTRRNSYTDSASVGTSGSAATGSASTLTTLPSGCTDFSKAGIAYKKCGQVYYRPTYQGPNLVYVTSNP